LVNAATPVDWMPGWDSLQTVAAVHGGFQLAGLLLLAVLAALAGVAAWQLRSREWPEWLDIGDYQLRSRFVEIGIAGALGLLLVSEVVAFGYGKRQHTLMAAAEQANAERIDSLIAEAKKQRPIESSNRYLKENSELRQRLNEAESKMASLERGQVQKHLTDEEKRFLIEALRPFAGQKVSIASIRGDDEGEAFAQDFVSVFDAAKWDHHGEAGVSKQRWDRDPVGVEVALNDADARAGTISPGVGALINAVRALGLVYDNTVWMDEEVPHGQALLKIGKKLRK
jgi:hypothetical protein